MILRQFLHTGPVGISYLLGCGGKAAGAVVDPVGDIQFYLRAAEETGMRMDDEIEFVAAMLRDVPRSPIDAARIRAVNAGLAVGSSQHPR